MNERMEMAQDADTGVDREGARAASLSLAEAGSGRTGRVLWAATCPDAKRKARLVLPAATANGALSEAAAGRGRGAADRCPLLPAAYLVQAVRAAGKCDAVFKGFSDCLLKLGDSMANYPQGLDDKTNIKTVCTYWEDFHSCTVTALTDCQEGAKDMWDKLRKESKNLNIQGSLFELCGSGNGAAGSLLPALPVLLVSLSAALATWLSF
ncbi:hypothetical protein HPG69_008706 [Diceros bicornis minor]|uniref:Neuritin n=1 Tax=Diceros bicornis minor TaxID=77932 RepID=A0A7J7FAI8_DICBM|nr:hypothetical protein HPG69_008706 [Diceros bicornis minor]